MDHREVATAETWDGLSLWASPRGSGWLLLAGVVGFGTPACRLRLGRHRGKLAFPRGSGAVLPERLALRGNEALPRTPLRQMAQSGMLLFTHNENLLKTFYTQLLFCQQIHSLRSVPPYLRLSVCKKSFIC